MKLYLFSSVSLVIAIGMLICGGSASFAAFNDKIQPPVAQTLKIQQRAQQQQDNWEKQRLQMLAKLQQLQREQQQLNAEKLKLMGQIQDCRTDIGDLQQAITESKRLTTQMEPFLAEVVERLGGQVAQDLPFLAEERSLRLTRLMAAVNDVQLNIGEKFRRVMEALQVEIAYGSNVSVTQETVAIAGRNVLMNQIRIGRLAMFAQSLDGQHSMVFDMASQQWQDVADDYNGEIGRALEMGQKHRPIDLLALPLGRVVIQ